MVSHLCFQYWGSEDGNLQRKLASYTNWVVKLGVQVREPNAYKVKKLRNLPNTNLYTPVYKHMQIDTLCIAPHRETYKKKSIICYKLSERQEDKVCQCISKEVTEEIRASK